MSTQLCPLAHMTPTDRRLGSVQEVLDALSVRLNGGRLACDLLVGRRGSFLHAHIPQGERPSRSWPRGRWRDLPARAHRRGGCRDG